MKFETSIEKLETIIEAIESPDIALDASMVLYEEGITLIKECGLALTQYEEEVKLLQKEADGVMALIPFEEEV